MSPGFSPVETLESETKASPGPPVFAFKSALPAAKEVMPNIPVVINAAANIIHFFFCIFKCIYTPLYLLFLFSILYLTTSAPSFLLHFSYPDQK